MCRDTISAFMLQPPSFELFIMSLDGGNVTGINCQRQKLVLDGLWPLHMTNHDTITVMFILTPLSVL